MKYIASFSGGKDSAATVILAHEHGEPLDEIIFSEVMYSDTISGELPEHLYFVKNVAFPLFESWGYKTRILHSNKTYLDCFNHVVEKPRKNMEHKGKKKGFVMVGHCDVQRDCKLKAISDYFKELKGQEITQYVGIAIDEPKRLERLVAGKVSLLQKYGYTEEMAKEKAAQYGLLSPCYDYSKRGGCWFCPNAKDGELRHLRNNHNDLWQELLRLEEIPDKIGNIWNTANNVSIHEIEERLFWEKAQMTVYDFL
ncbi:MAG: hypothetical protein K1W28_03380 [Lachnospiraceae bacterium]